MGTSDVTLYAIYKKTLTAKFIDYSGTTKKTRTATATIYNNATSGTVSAPTQNAYTGWTKRGWTTSTSAGASAVSSYSISSDTTYYGLYSRTLTLSYNKNGGNTTPSSQTGTQYANSYAISSTKNPSFTLAGAISKSGSTFGGWAANSTSGTKYSAGSSISISSDTTMYAVWNINSYKVTYNYSYNGGTSATKTTTVVEEGSTIDLTPTATKSGWTFVGWNTDKNATTGLTSLKMGTGDVTLYAIYKKTLTATFVDYSGTAKKTRTATATIYNNATSGTVSAPTQNAYTGWTKRGWATSTTANASSVSSYSISADTIFYGLYSRTLTLSYNKNGGNTTPSSQTGTQYANSYAISSTKNPSFTLAGAISKSGSTFGGWAVNSTSGTKYSAGSSITISSNTTMYAVWQVVVNIYNLGEETYSFYNFVDSDSRIGHCFGMSATSSGYYLGELDIFSIGIDDSSELYTVSKTSKVTAPICFYQNKQGWRAENSIVAGGSYMKNQYNKNKSNINSDWQSTVNYVKNGKYNDSGKFQIEYWGYYKGSSFGGHAVNFLRYENINGQDRIYVYDNNFPNIETYFYEKNGYVYQAPYATIDTQIVSLSLNDVSKYFDLVESFDESKVLYAYENEVEISNVNTNVSPLAGYFGEKLVMMYEVNENVGSVTITPLVDNATFEYMGVKYSFNEINESTCGVLQLETTDAGNNGEARFTIINDPGKVKSVSIDNFSLNYKASTTVSPSINVDSGVKYTVSYSSSDDSVATVDSNGKVTAKGTGSATITVTVTDEYGNTVSDTCEVSVSYQWWEWIIVIVLFGWIWY